MARMKLPTGAAVEFDEEQIAAPARQVLPAGAAVEFDDEQEQPGVAQALARGAAQGATLNFSDEIVGLGEALFSREGLTGDSHAFAQRYRKSRDESRAANRAAQDAHPIAYGAGELGGGIATSFVPGLGLAKGANVLRQAAGAAKLGAAAGLGGSEKEDIGGQLVDAAGSALVAGGTTGLLGKVLKGAPERVVKRALGDVTDGATATMRDRVVGKAGKNVGDVMEVLSDKSFKKAGRDSGKLLEAAESALQETGARLDEAYAAAGGRTAGIKVSDVLGDVEAIASRLAKDPGKADLARAVQGKAEDVLNAWGNRTHVPASEVRVLASDIADAAFRGSPAVSPKAGQGVAQEVWGTLKDRIAANFDESGVGSKEVAKLNKRMSTLMGVREAVRYKATREATESTRLKDRIGSRLDMGLALADPTTFVAKKTYDFVGAPLVRKADERLAQLVTAARNGSKAAQIKERALLLGFSPVVAGSLSTWAQRTAQEMTGGYQASSAE